MKFKNLLMSGMIAILAGFFVVGCEETPSTPTGNGVDAPTDLEAVTLGATSVGLKWVGAVPVGSRYDVSWTNADGTSTGEKSVNEAVSTTVEGLTAGVEYTFSVVFVNADGDASLATTINWAGATRYPVAGSTVEINMYEFDSDNGSGLILDGATGPENASMSANNPNLGEVQLAFFLNSDGTFSIGPSFGYPSTTFANADGTDPNVIVSDQIFTTPSLDDWYLASSLTSLLTQNSQNIFDNLAAARTDGAGYAFVVRIGSDAASYHFARVFIKPDSNGNFINGVAPNRFISLEISYQNTVNLPFAK